MINMSTSLFRRGVLILLCFLVSSGNTLVSYKDMISGDEMFTDDFPMTTLLDCFYKVQGRIVAVTRGVAEETEDVETVPGCNIVINSGLVIASPSFDKNSFKKYMKGYVKKVSERMVEEEIGQETIDEFKRTVPHCMKYLLKNIRDFDI